MAKGWASKHEFKKMRGELGSQSDRGFERACLSYLRLAYPSIVTPPSRRRFDGSGVDHFVWADTSPLPLVVQCKGFEVHEWEIGKSQAQQCVQSVQSFLDSPLSTDTYLLIHNRTNRDPQFRAVVQVALDSLVAAGRARFAELWDADRLVGEALNSIFAKVKRLASEGTLSVVKDYAAAEPELCEPLLAVPVRTSLWTASQYQLEREQDSIELDADPAKLVLESDAHFTVLVGYAGFGKTTATLRVATATKNKTFFSPASRIDKINTKAMLARCIDVERLLEGVPPEDTDIAQRSARLAVDRFFKIDDASFLLLIDALDESAPLARRGGLQEFFNGLREVRCRVAVTVRKEFFDARTSDFAVPFGTISRRENRKHNQTLQVIELLPWSDGHILRLVNRYTETLDEPAARERLAALASAVESGRYTAFYGDIPRRPLFLRFILETVSSAGIHPVSRAGLFEEWARLKILRDLTAPARTGGHRLPVLAERGADDTVELAFAAMTVAAGAMTSVRDGQIELLPDCAFSDIAAHPMLRDVQLDALVLNSLLVPTSRRTGVKPARVRFAHRAFQEFFLARFLDAQPDAPATVVVPPDVAEWRQ